MHSLLLEFHITYTSKYVAQEVAQEVTTRSDVLQGEMFGSEDGDCFNVRKGVGHASSRLQCAEHCRISW